MLAKDQIDDTVGFSICTTIGNGYISISRNLFIQLIKVFHCNDKGQIFCKQIANDTYFNRLKQISLEFKKRYPETYQLFDFLEKIPKNECFFIIQQNVNKDKSLNNYLNINKQLHEINGIPFPDLGLARMDLYYIYIFGDKRISFRDSDKKERVCRFCGKSFPTVHFRNKSHAISESLGNKLLFCNEECDECNEKFGKGIERDLFSIYHLHLAINGKRGKYGQRNLKGKSIEVDNKNGGSVLFKSDKCIDYIDNLNSQIKEPTLSYIPQNIYKCISKFAISLIDKEHLPRLAKTIEWVTSDEMYKKLPPIWFKQTAMHDQPLIYIYVKKESENKEMPEFIINLFVVNTEYLFTFPYVDNLFVEVYNDEVMKYLNDVFKLDGYSKLDLSSNEKKDLSITLDIKLQEGSEIISVRRSEYELLSESERILRYPNASAFYIEDDCKE